MNPIDAVEILLVEDNPRDAELTVRALRKNHLANKLFVVEDGSSALDFIFRRGEFSGRSQMENPKIILLDIKLPRVGGLEVLKEIKSDPRSRIIPVIMVTSSREDPDIATAYEYGANSYVVKPVEFEAFQEAMNHLGLYWLLINQSPDLTQGSR
jgi:two-component system response regulator